MTHIMDFSFLNKTMVVQTWKRVFCMYIIVLSNCAILTVNGSPCVVQPPCDSCEEQWIQDNTNCMHYYRCYAGQSYEFKCSPGTVFSVQLKTCISEESEYNDCVEDTDEVASAAAAWSEETQEMPPITPPTPKWFAEPGDVTDVDSCGLTMAGRIVGGGPGNIGNWPWQVSLQLIRGYRSIHFCGGVLIDSEWILLAAHCVYRKSADDFFVLLGTDRKSDWPKHTAVRRIIEIYMHPDFYYGGGYPNDIALLRMEAPVSFNAFVTPACIPAVFDDFTGEDCYITGFGETLGTSSREILNQLKIRVMDSDECASAWGQNIYDSHICLGNGTIGACWGDSGGPLSCLRHGRFVVAGVASWGFRTCNRFGYPNVYTRVSSHIDWINTIIYTNYLSST